jgi:hypothetical protein
MYVLVELWGKEVVINKGRTVAHTAIIDNLAIKWTALA